MRRDDLVGNPGDLPPAEEARLAVERMDRLVAVSTRRPCMAVIATGRCANTLMPDPGEDADWRCADGHRWSGRGRVLRSVVRVALPPEIVFAPDVVPPWPDEAVIESVFRHVATDGEWNTCTAACAEMHTFDVGCAAGATFTPPPPVAVVPAAVREAIVAGRCPACHHAPHVARGCDERPGSGVGCGCAVETATGDSGAVSVSNPRAGMRAALGLDEMPGDTDMGDVLGMRPHLDTAAWERHTATMADELLDRLARGLDVPRWMIDPDLEDPDAVECHLDRMLRRFDRAVITAAVAAGAVIVWRLCRRRG